MATSGNKPITKPLKDSSSRPPSGTRSSSGQRSHRSSGYPRKNSRSGNNSSSRTGGSGGSGSGRSHGSSSGSHRSGRSGAPRHTKKMTFVNRPPEKLGPYKITKEIGKGAFGRVYKCVDTRTLRVFAIKTITTRNMNAQQKKDVQSEVELLASLPPHENIVRYIETVQDSSFFCIVLEYVDLGSLQSFIRKYGTDVTEQNVASFIIQILSGLHFLHEQGIIHRDIKAANVLITNDGVAKLADFGVAIKSKGDGGANNIMDEEVAGSPYWMAPEIIEMRGQLTPACDIWAVGATAIELFTGHPPYHNLQAMSALFRIVQDPHPEIPAKASNLFKEFLYQCFCKDPSRRPSARDLQSHKWLINMMQDNNKLYPEATNTNYSASGSGGGGSGSSSSSSQTREAHHKSSVHKNKNESSSNSNKLSRDKPKPDVDDRKQSAGDDEDDDTDPETEELNRGLSVENNTALLQSTVKLGKKKLQEELARQREEDTMRKKLNSNKKSLPEDAEHDDVDPTAHLTGTFKKGKDGQNTLTIDGKVIQVNTNIPSLGVNKVVTKKNLFKKQKTPKSKKEKEKDTKKKKEKKKEEESEEDDDDSSWGTDSDDDSDSSDSDSDSDDDTDDSDDSDSDDDSGDSEESSGDFGEVVVNANDFATRFDDHEVEDEESDEDESDWVDEEELVGAENTQFGNQNQLDAINQILKKLDENITHLQHFEGAGPNASNGIDTQREQEMVNELTKLNQIFEKSPQLIGQCIKTAIIPIMEMLSIPSEDVKCTALDTMKIIISDPKEGQQHLQTLCLVQLIPAIGNMVRVRSIKIKNAAAPFLTKFCEDGDKSGHSKKSKNFVRQMFIACGGIGILVDCLRNKYCNDNKKIIFVAVDCIHSIFESRMHNRRDLGRLFTKAKLLKRLLKRLHDSFGDVDDINTAIAYGEKMAEIFFRIAELTDRVVKTNISGTSAIAANMPGMMGMLAGMNGMFANVMNVPNIVPNMNMGINGINNLPTISHLANNVGSTSIINQPRINEGANGQRLNSKHKDSSILAQLLGLLPALEDDAKNGGKRKTILLRILKSFAELSKDSNCIGPLIEAKTMSTVVPFLKSPDQDIQTCVVMILWNMTRVNNHHSTKARREAAENGAIPILKQLIRNKAHKSMYFLVQTICKFPNDADDATLFEMKKHNMCQFYINMTRSGHGLSLDALSALARWIENEEYVPRLEFVLCQPDNITQLIQLFKNPIGHKNNKRGAGKSKNVNSILDAFKSLIFKSKRIADKLGDSNVFLEALGEWFQNDHLPQEIVNGLLQMLTKMFEYLEPSSKKKCAKTILPIIDKVFQMGKMKKKAVVVHLISKELIPNISLHVDQADIDDLCPELRRILDPSHIDH